MYIWCLKLHCYPIIRVGYAYFPRALSSTSWEFFREGCCREGGREEGREGGREEGRKGGREGGRTIKNITNLYILEWNRDKYAMVREWE